MSLKSPAVRPNLRLCSSSLRELQLSCSSQLQLSFTILSLVILFSIYLHQNILYCVPHLWCLLWTLQRTIRHYMYAERWCIISWFAADKTVGASVLTGLFTLILLSSDSAMWCHLVWYTASNKCIPCLVATHNRYDYNHYKLSTFCSTVNMVQGIS